MRAADVLELGVVRQPDRVGGGDGRRFGRLDPVVASATPAGAVSRSTGRLGIDRRFVTRSSDEVELSQSGLLQRAGAVVDRTVEPEDTVADA